MKDSIGDIIVILGLNSKITGFFLLGLITAATFLMTGKYYAGSMSISSLPVPIQDLFTYIITERYEGAAIGSLLICWIASYKCYRKGKMKLFHTLQ